MFGWIHESLKELVTRKFGKETWRKILLMACMEESTEYTINHYYKDEETFKLAKAMSSVVGLPINSVWQAYGEFLIDHTLKNGLDEVLASVAHDLFGFLNNLDALHYFFERVVYKFKLRGPSFHCEKNLDGSFTLHYYSMRTGLYPIVLGAVTDASKRLFKTNIQMNVVDRKTKNSEKSGKSAVREYSEHVVFIIRELHENEPVGQQLQLAELCPKFRRCSVRAAPPKMSITPQEFSTMIPFHVCFDHQLKISHYGSYITKKLGTILTNTSNLIDVFDVVRPELTLSYENFRRHINSNFVLKLKLAHTDSKKDANRLSLIGQMNELEDKTHMIFICSPFLTTTQEMVNQDIYFNDIPLHDATRDLILLNQSADAQQKLNEKLEATTNSLKEMAFKLEKESEKSDLLLCELMPQSIVDQLRKSQPIESKEFPDATILFCDIVSFTVICSQCKPIEVVQLLSELYSKFDRLTILNDVYKILTIGDCYMAVGGVPDKCPNHTEKLCDLAIGMLLETRTVLTPKSEPLKVRIGIHCGPVIASVVGKTQPRYCLFGDTVTVASKMESTGVPMKTQISKAVYEKVSNVKTFSFKDRGWVKISQREKIYTYFLLDSTNEKILRFTSSRTLSVQFNEKNENKFSDMNAPNEDVLDVSHIEKLRRNSQPKFYNGIAHRDSETMKFMMRIRDKEFTVRAAKTCALM